MATGDPFCPICRAMFFNGQCMCPPKKLDNYGDNEKIALLEKRIKDLEAVLQGIIDSTVHPEIAVRMVVDLAPIRKILKKT